MRSIILRWLASTFFQKATGSACVGVAGMVNEVLEILQAHFGFPARPSVGNRVVTHLKERSAPRRIWALQDGSQ